MLTQRQTRAKNSDQHPGAVVNKLRTRRTKEEILREKEGKERRREEQASKRDEALREKEEKEKQKEERAALREAAAQQAAYAREKRKLIAEQKRAAKEQEASEKVRKKRTAAEQQETAILETMELENNLSKALDIRTHMGSTAPKLAGTGKRGRNKSKGVPETSSTNDEKDSSCAAEDGEHLKIPNSDAPNRERAKKARKKDTRGALPFRTRVQGAKGSNSAISGTGYHSTLAGQNSSLSGEDTDMIESPNTSKQNDRTKRPVRALRNTDGSTFFGGEGRNPEVAGTEEIDL